MITMRIVDRIFIFGAFFEIFKFSNVVFERPFCFPPPSVNGRSEVVQEIHVLETAATEIFPELHFLPRSRHRDCHFGVWESLSAPLLGKVVAKDTGRPVGGPWRGRVASWLLANVRRVSVHGLRRRRAVEDARLVPVKPPVVVLAHCLPLCRDRLSSSWTSSSRLRHSGSYKSIQQEWREQRREANTWSPFCWQLVGI